MKFKQILILSAIFYIFISSVTYHPDPVLPMLWTSLLKPWQFNIYDFIVNNKLTMIVGMFNYNPFLLVLFKIQYFFAYLISGAGYKDWINIPFLKESADYNIFKYIFATKLLLILLVFYCAWIIYKLVIQYSQNKIWAERVVLFWLINPITIYSTAMIGQNDIFTLAFFLTGWLLLASNYWWSLLLFGLSIAIKNYPLVWTFILVSLTNFKKFYQKIFAYIIPVFIFVLTLLPFIKSEPFRKEIFNSALTERLFVASIDMGFSDQVIIIPTLVIVLVIVALFYAKKKLDLSQKSFLLMTSSLLILGFMHFHVQWFLWFMPFWSIWFTNSKTSKNLQEKILLSLVIFFGWVLVLLMFADQTLYFGMFSPVSLGFLSYPDFPYILSHFGVDYIRIKNLGHSIIAGVSLWMLIKSFNFKNEE
ncbi:DUF2029 domain-containing protein [Candidatus Beckwithbacteria bacterium]|nr:DUF2029 domain-containing protein [Candidatus Beckwithbacteria bacterium]